MLNEEKIRLMTGIAMFEKKAGKEIMSVNRYFKGDYVSSRMIRSFILYTFACTICFGLWLLYRIEEIMDTMDVSVIFGSLRLLAGIYLAGLAVYILITWRVYSRRYQKAGKSLKVYQAKLKRLERKYHLESGEEGKLR